MKAKLKVLDDPSLHMWSNIFLSRPMLSLNLNHGPPLRMLPPWRGQARIVSGGLSMHYLLCDEPFAWEGPPIDMVLPPGVDPIPLL